MAELIGALDQGTTSTRFMIFDRGGRIVAQAQKDHEQIYPQPGWVEHDPREIWQRTLEVIEAGLQRGGAAGRGPCVPRDHQPARDDGGLGPAHGRAGLQRAGVAGYAGGRVRGRVCARGRAGPVPREDRAAAGNVLQRVEDCVDSGSCGRRARNERNAASCSSATIDSYPAVELDRWRVWRLHCTDVTNASRTQLMNLRDAGVG